MMRWGGSGIGWEERDDGLGKMMGGYFGRNIDKDKKNSGTRSGYTSGTTRTRHNGFCMSIYGLGLRFSSSLH